MVKQLNKCKQDNEELVLTKNIQKDILDKNIPKVTKNLPITNTKSSSKEKINDFIEPEKSSSKEKINDLIETFVKIFMDTSNQDKKTKPLSLSIIESINSFRKELSELTVNILKINNPNYNIFTSNVVPYYKQIKTIKKNI